MRSSWLAGAAALAGFALTMEAANPPVTIIQDTLYKADGTPFDGVAQIEWKSFQAVNGAEVPQNAINLRITNGALRVSLVPTTNSLKPAFYTVRFNASGRAQFVEFWSVPASSVALKLCDVRTHGAVASPVTTPPTTIAVQDVAGLRTELDLRPARGSSWMTSRTARIGATGAVESVIGNSGDCVRVDGTAVPCGNGGLLFVDADTPAGLIDGINTAFALSSAPEPPNSLNLHRNGVLLRQGVEYTLTGSNVNFAPGHAPTPGDSLHANYRIASDATLTVNIIDLETPAGAIDGANRVFSLAEIPLPPSSVQVYRNGLLQRAGVDYDVAVNTITFTPVSTPQPGDILQVTYRK